MRPFNGNLEPTALAKEWVEWKRSFEIYLMAEEVTNQERCKILLLHKGGRDLQVVFDNLPALSSESDHEIFTNAINRLDEFFVKKRNDTFERISFRKMTQTNDETFDQFVLRLRQHIARCGFKSDEDEHLRDQIIVSCTSKELKRRAMEKAMSLDEIMTAGRGIKLMGPIGLLVDSNSQVNNMYGAGTSGTSAEVNRIQRTNSRNNFNSRVGCSRCGSWKHESRDQSCPAKSLNCFKCGLKGHYAHVCKTKRNEH